MKRLFALLPLVFVAVGLNAQDMQQVAADAAKAAETAPAVEQKVEKPKYWTNSLKTNVSVGQTGLFNWAAGGDNTVSVQAFVDGNANWAKNHMFWNNRLQLDYGFLYASSKPILQKSTDRIYLESKWGYNVSKDVLFCSANFDFKSQFSSGWDYNTPDINVKDLKGAALRNAWKAARVKKSNFLAPAYTNLALGIDYVPTKWLSISFAPLTGGFVIVKDAALRKSYSMDKTKGTLALDERFASYDEATATEQDKVDYAAYQQSLLNGTAYRSAKFEFGAQLKADIKVNVNDNFSYTSQIVLFANYLDIKHCPRINWDNRFDWKIAKYFSLTLTTNLIYDDKVMITNEKDIDQFPNGKARLQFKESLAFGFTYTIASKKN